MKRGREIFNHVGDVPRHSFKQDGRNVVAVDDQLIIENAILSRPQGGINRLSAYGAPAWGLYLLEGKKLPPEFLQSTDFVPGGR